MTPILATVLIMLAVAIYLLPAILAGLRGHASAWGIFALNLLLGWSGILWIIALIWALSNKGQANQQVVVVHNHNNEAQQPEPAPPIYVPVPVHAGTRPSLDALPNLPLVEGDTKACHACAETIKAAATKCRYCGEPQGPLLTQ